MSESNVKRFSIAIISALLVAASTGLSRPAPSKAEDDFQLVTVADGIYAAIAQPTGVASGNAGFIVGDSGVLVVDTFLTPAAAQEMVDEIAKRTTQPVKYAVNTHYHLDHSGGNQVFAALGVPIIAQQNTLGWVTTKNMRFLPPPDQLQRTRDDAEKKLAGTPQDQTAQRQQLETRLRRLDAMMAIKLTPPSMTYDSGTLHLFLGKREVILFTLPGHTGGDTLVYVPDADVLFTGDMGWSRTLPNLVDATVVDWIASLDKVLSQYGKSKFVPGHGNVADAADMRAFRDYLDDLRSRVKRGIADGFSVDQAKEELKLPDKYKSFAFQNFAQPNVEDMYKELKGTKQVK